jgi:alpha-ribazole phosphatase
VIHGGSIRAAAALALDLTPAAALRLRVDHWSLTRLDHHATADGSGSWSVGCVNRLPGRDAAGR